MTVYDPADLDRRLPGESAAAHFTRSLAAVLAQGFAEAGCPLSDEQLVFLQGVDEAVRA